jgi:hypothetical protein
VEVKEAMGGEFVCIAGTHRQSANIAKIGKVTFDDVIIWLDECGYLELWYNIGLPEMPKNVIDGVSCRTKRLDLTEVTREKLLSKFFAGIARILDSAKRQKLAELPRDAQDLLSCCPFISIPIQFGGQTIQTWGERTAPYLARLER